jgi:putative MFS transporter
VSLAGIAGRVAFSFLSELIGRRPAGIILGFGGMICIAIAGIGHNVMIGSVSLFWLMIVCADFFYDGGFAVIGPYMAEVWPTRLRTTGMGSAYGFGGLGKIIGPLGLALMIGASDVIKPQATVAAIVPGFLYFAAWMALCGCAFLFFGFETGRQSLTEIDASLQTAAAIERQQGAD